MNRYLSVALFLTLSIFSSASYASIEDEEDVLPFKSVERVSPFLISSTEIGFSASPELLKAFKAWMFEGKRMDEALKHVLADSYKKAVPFFANAYFGANFPVNQYFSVGFKAGFAIDTPCLNHAKDEINSKTTSSLFFFTEKLTPITIFLTKEKDRISREHAGQNEWQYQDSLSQEDKEILQKFNVLNTLRCSALIYCSKALSAPSVTTSFSIPFKFTYPISLGQAGDIAPFLSLDCGIKIVGNLPNGLKSVVGLMNDAYATSQDKLDPWALLFDKNFFYGYDIIAYLQPSVGLQYYPVEWVGVSVGYFLPTYNMSLNSAYKNSAQRILSYLGADASVLKDEFYDWNFVNYSGHLTFGVHITF